MNIRTRTAMLACEALLGLFESKEFTEYSEDAKVAYKAACDELWAQVPEDLRGEDWDAVEDYIVFNYCEDVVGEVQCYGYQIITGTDEDQADIEGTDNILGWIEASGFVPPDDDGVTQTLSRALEVGDDPDEVYKQSVRDWNDSGCKVIFIPNPVGHHPEGTAPKGAR